MARPKNASNLCYRGVDAPLLLQMHELVLDGLKLWPATIQVVRKQFGLDEQYPYDDKNVRRLHDKYLREEDDIAAKVERRRNPPPPPRRLMPHEIVLKAQRDREAFLRYLNPGIIEQQQQMIRDIEQQNALLRALTKNIPW